MILIGLGANLPSIYGSPAQSLVFAQRLLAERGMRIVVASEILRTAPVPASDQPWYANAVVRVETDLRPAALLKVLQQIEREFGRVRAGQRNEARVLDLDLLAYYEEVIQMEGFLVPHPRLHERGFVLYPLRQVAADWVHPVLKLCVDEMIEKLPNDQVVDRLSVQNVA